MPIRTFRCLKCNKDDEYFDHDIRDQKVACACGNRTDFKKLMSVPLENKITIDTKDYYTGAKQEKGIQEDLRKRSTKHVNDTLRETIADLAERFGEKESEKIAKEQGWLITDDGGKTWRLRSDFDTGTLNSRNQGTYKPKIGKE